MDNSIISVLQENEGDNTKALIYFIVNIQTFMEHSKSMKSYFLKNFYDYEGTIKAYYYIFFAIIASSFIALALLSIPFILELKTYQEKISIIISRINDTEINNEIFKNNECIGFLENIESNNWLFQDFISI